MIDRVVGRNANRKKVAKHFEIGVEDDYVRWSRRQRMIEAEARLDGICIVRASLPAERLGALTLNRVTLTRDNPDEFELLARATPPQREVFALLGVDPARVVSTRLTA